MTKFGNIKRQHGRVSGLDEILDRIMRECSSVTKIVPGRMGRKRGRTSAPLFKIQYATTPGGHDDRPASGLKCIYTSQGSWQEVFLVCDDVEAASEWLEDHFGQPPAF